MKLRSALQVSLVTLTVVAAALSVASGGLWIAGGLVAGAMAVAGAPLARPVSGDELKTLLESLRISQREGTSAVNAVVTAKTIFIAKAAIHDSSSIGYTLLFRDEMELPDWRELATLLRHQTRPSTDVEKADQAVAYRLGKSSDL